MNRMNQIGNDKGTGDATPSVTVTYRPAVGGIVRTAKGTQGQRRARSHAHARSPLVNMRMNHAFARKSGAIGLDHRAAEVQEPKSAERLKSRL